MAVKLHSATGLKVSSEGCVFIPTDKYHKGHWEYGHPINKDGYLYFTFYRKVYNVARLVADTFVPNPEHKPTVDHINRVRIDNSVENLRWATFKEQADNTKSVLNRKTKARRCEDRNAAAREYYHLNVEKHRNRQNELHALRRDEINRRQRERYRERMKDPEYREYCRVRNKKYKGVA